MAPPPQGPSATTSAAAPSRQLGQGQQQFVSDLAPYALQVQQETGIPYQLLLAIPANETGWGQAVQGNNYFGIKGPGQVSKTWEVENGQRQDTQASFRTYGSPIESMRDFASLIASSPRYSNVRDYLNQHPNDWRSAAQLLLNDGYATDPQWADKVISLGNQIDTGPSPSSISPSTGVKSIVDTGAQALGMRYQWGGSGGRGQSALQANTDCSGFVSWAVEQATGVRLPAQTQGIYASTLAVAPNQAMPGDLVMFNMGQGASMEHVGIYAGGNMMLHDSSLNPNGGVDLTPLWSGAEFRRIPNVDPSLVTRPQNDSLSTSAPAHPDRAPVKDWAVVNLNGQQVWLGTGADGSVQRQVLGASAQGMPEGQVIDASFLQSVPQTQTPTVPTGGGNEVGAGAEAPNPTMAKREAGYTKSASEDHCQDCSMFRANTCTLVKGYIHDRGSCDYFEPKKVGMGAGQDEGDDAAPYYAGYVDPEGVQHDLPPPSAQVVSRAADLGWLGPEASPAAQGQRAEAAQYTADQAQIQDEADFLARQQTSVPAPPPAALTASAQDANAAVGRFDLSGVPTDSTRKPISAPISPTPSQGPPRRSITPVPAASPETVTDAASAPPVQTEPAPPAPSDPRSELALQTGMPVLGSAAQRQAATQPAQPPTDVSGPSPVEQAVSGVVDWAAPGLKKLASPEVQGAISTAATVAQDIANPINMAPGVAAAVDYVRANGYDPQPALDKLLKPTPGGALDRYAKTAAAGNQADLGTSVAAGSEALSNMNDFRAGLVAAAQPPEIRDSPEGQAAAQGIALISDPLNLVGMPEVNAGRRLLTEGVELATPAAERELPRLMTGFAERNSPEFRAAETALGRPWTAQESQRVLQAAALDLSPAEARLMEDASRALTAGGRYEPLSGEQLRRTVLNAVSRENPGAKPNDILRMVDQTLSHAGAEELTTDRIVQNVQPAVREATEKSLTSLGYPMVAGMTQPEIDKLWYTDPTAVIARMEEYARRGLLARQPAAASGRMAIGAAGGAAAGLTAADMRIDPDDVNRKNKLAAAGLIGALAGTVGGYAAVPLWKGFDGKFLAMVRDVVAPVENTLPETQDIIRKWAGTYQSGATASERLADRMRGIFGSDADTWLAGWIEEHGSLPQKYRTNTEAQAFLRDWQAITAWARKYDIVPDPLNLGASSRVKTYVPHAVKAEMDRAIVLGKDATKPRRGYTTGNPFDHYNENRTFETLRDGVKAKGQDFYDDDVPRVWGNYYGAAIKALANNQLMEDLLSVAAKNNGSVFASRALRQAMLKGEDIVRLGPGISPRELGQATNLGEFIPKLRSQDVYISNDLATVMHRLFRDQSWFEKWGAASNTLSINTQFKHNVLSGSMFHLVNEVRQMYATQGWQASRNLWTMAHQMTTPGGARNFFDSHAREMTLAIRDGLQMNMAADRPSHAWGWQMAQMFGNALVGGIMGYQTGTSDEERKQNALHGAALGVGFSAPIFGGKFPLGPEAKSIVQVFSDALWQRYIPFMKYTTYEMYKPQFGGRAAAEFANEVYGGMNLMAVGRSRTFQDALKFFVLAPDWQEGWARQVGNAAFNWQGPLGQMNRTYWRNAALQSVFMLEAMNRALGGKWSWENDPDAWGLINMSQTYDKFGWDHRDPTTGQPYTPYLDILGPYRAMLEPLRETARAATVAAASGLGIKPTDVPFHREIYGDFGDIPEPDPGKAWGNFASSRVGFLPVSIHQMLSGKDWANRPLDQPDDSGMQIAFNRAAQVLQHAVPTGEQGLITGAQRGDPLPIGALSVLGLRTSHRSATNKYFEMRDQFVKDLGVGPDEWQHTLAATRSDNQDIDQRIELLQSGQGTYNGQDVSKMTARERDNEMIKLSQSRVSLHENLQKLITERTGLSDEDKAKYAQQLQWLDRQTIVGSTKAPADIEGRPDLNVDELMRLAWNRDPTEIERIKGTRSKADWTQDPWGAAGQSLDDVLLRPSPGSDATRQLATLRARWTIDTASQWGVDPAVLEDHLKANLYGVQGGPPKLPGVTSAALDQIVKDYQKAGLTDAGEQIPGTVAGLAKQDYLFETAAQLGVDPHDLATRIRLRTLPMADQTEAGSARSNALDLLSSGKMVPFQNPDGTPLGNPKEWASWDSLLAHSKDRSTFKNGLYYAGAGGKSADELNQLNAAKQQANANRYKMINLSPHKDDYQRWFGDGANMTDAQWQQLQAGTLDMWTDKPTPDEAKRRVGVLRLAQGYTKPELNNSKLQFSYTDTAGYRYTNDSLAAYVRFINSVKSSKYAYVGAALDPEPAS